MTLRSSLARYVRGLLLEEPPTPPASPPPTPSPESTPPTTTRSLTTTDAASEAGLLAVVLSTMRDMQTENLREIRGMVMDILQGREMTIPATNGATRPEEGQPSSTPYDPPDYDSEDLSDLPEGIQSIFDRERQEVSDLRHLRTEREVLAAQLDEARAMLVDPQGPASVPSSLTD